MPADLQQQYERRWQTWIVEQPWSTQASLGDGLGRVGVVVMAALRGMLRFVVTAAVVIGLFGVVWFWYDWNYGGADRRVERRLTSNRGVESALVSEASWNGIELSVGEVQVEYQNRGPLAELAVEKILARALPWQLMDFPMATARLEAHHSSVELRVGSEAASEGTSSPWPWNADSIHFRNLELGWFEAGPSGGNLDFDIVAASRDAEGRWKAEINEGWGRIGWLGGLNFWRGLRLIQTGESTWQLGAADIRQGQDNLFDLDLIARWGERLDLSGEVDWKQLEVGSIRRCASAGLRSGSLRGATDLEFDFDQLRGMRMTGRLEVDSERPLRLHASPLVDSLGRLLRLGTLSSLLFDTGYLNLSSDGFHWELDDINLSGSRGVSLRGWLHLESRVEAGETIVRQIHREEAEANNSETSFFNEDETLDDALGGDRPGLQVSGRLVIGLDSELVNANHVAELVRAGAVEEHEGWLEIELEFEDLASTEEVGEALATEFDRRAAFLSHKAGEQETERQSEGEIWLPGKTKATRWPGAVGP